uniref:HAT C-terminal dimerisation domain-containing protein n=1 Tax=Meloidogyne javanica TaxID=6303 RepID=A0A915LK66_MELJA
MAPQQFNADIRNISLESLLVAPLPSPAELNVRQRAEIEVNDYLHSKKSPLGADPFAYWFGQNAIKWPMLSKLSTKFLSAPASSSESERVFSTAGLIVSNLRKAGSKEVAVAQQKIRAITHSFTLYPPVHRNY